MAVAANRAIGIKLTGDVNAPNLAYNAAENATSPGQIQNIALSSGFNQITPPTGSKAVTIVPPAGNAITLTLKGVTGDTGIALHLTDPSSIALAGVTAFGITTNGTVTLRFIWT